MTWLTAAIAIALAIAIAFLGGVTVGLVALAAIGWLALTLRPVEAGVLVADWSRRRFE